MQPCCNPCIPRISCSQPFYLCLFSSLEGVLCLIFKPFIITYTKSQTPLPPTPSRPYDTGPSTST